jgi:hypothetical protein
MTLSRFKKQVGMYIMVAFILAIKCVFELLTEEVKRSKFEL